jgi:hypothetical protein
MANLFWLVVAFAVSGCTSTYTRTNLAEPVAVLQRGKSVAIATPADGVYGTTEYASSGKSTALAVRGAFAKFAGETSIVSACKDLACLREQAGAESDYLVVPEILHWEDRNTEWSGIKDSIEIKLAVYDSKSGNELAASVIAGKSKWATFGGDHPQDLLPEPIYAYVATLF